MQNSNDNKLIIHENKEDADQRKTGSTKVLSRTTIANLVKTRTNTSLRIDHSKDKELINSGLHKLVSSFNTVNKVGHKTSKMSTNRKESRTPLSINPERQLNSHIVLKKQISIDKYTMTDFQENEKKLDLETTALIEEPTYRDLQWTDPRLLKKYALVNNTNNSNNQQMYKKSMTVPYVNKKEIDSEANELLSDEEAELFFQTQQKNNFLFKCLYYFCTTSVSFIGSMCGITFITVILWKILDENILNFRLIEPPQQHLFFTRLFLGLAGAIFHGINAILTKLGRLLTISTNEAFARDENAGWFSNFLRH